MYTEKTFNVELHILFLEKLEKLTDRERNAIIEMIEIINKPILLSNK